MSGIKKIAEIELKKAVTAFYRQVCEINDVEQLCEIYWLIKATHKTWVLETLMGMPVWQMEEARNMHYTFAKMPLTVNLIFEKITFSVFCKNCALGDKKLAKTGLYAYITGEIKIGSKPLD